MRILLTGITGYLGSHLAAALLEQGHEVIALKRSTASTRRLEPFLERLALYDIGAVDPASVFAAHGRVDAVVHTATCYGKNGETASQMVEANLSFPLRLMDAAIAAGVGMFVNADTSLDKFLNAYSLSKGQFVEWGRHLARQGKIRFLNLRLEHFYGVGDDASKFTTHVINSCLANAPELKLTPGEQKRDFIHIDDVVDAYLLLLRNGERLDNGFSEFDIGSGEAVTIRGFAQLVRGLTNSVTMLNFGAYPYRDGEVMFSQANIEPLQQLGWRCRYTLEQGLKKVIEGSKE